MKNSHKRIDVAKIEWILSLLDKSTYSFRKQFMKCFETNSSIKNLQSCFLSGSKIVNEKSLINLKLSERKDNPYGFFYN